MCKAYTDIGGINKYVMVCSHEREIIHSPKLVGYLHVQADNCGTCITITDSFSLRRFTGALLGQVNF